MKLVLRHPLAALVAITFLTVAGCASIPIREQTQQWYVPADGVTTDAGSIAVRNIVLVADENGSLATVIATFANSGAGDDELVEVRVADQVTPPSSGPLEIPADGYARLGPDADRLDVSGADVEPGRFVDVEFVFRDAPRAEVQALVQRAEGVYANALDGAESPTPSPL